VVSSTQPVKATTTAAITAVVTPALSRAEMLLPINPDQSIEP